ncbi:Ethanolamine utilization protein EutQ [Geosmithia morbida]|uniref:Ethanolamine utilization protein EutQ n=1 Tax=Geosmithia morbida TaxID=1094350 RepID=A0A9P4YTF5_9HYPO|nr:Ethanolamine utilization protein EutQ [Geosmithia morbida]KAF4121393.1 Ethanolamine utilization protein EutQ [Geosmithia morbida]
MSSDSPAFQFYPQAQSAFKIPLLANDNAYLGDIFSSESTSDAPISSGLFRLKEGQPLTYTYKYDEMKIFLEGDYTITDTTGQTTKAKPGDVVFFPKGSTITFETENGGLAFYVGQRKKNDF